jgi:hypothetical protein
VRIVLVAPDNVLLAGSNDETQFPGVPGLIGFTLNFLNPAAVICRQGPSAKNNVGLSTSLLVTPYLTSMTTPESPGLLVEGATTSWFQVYVREFNYSFERAGPAWRPAVASALRPPRRGTHHWALGACVAQDTTHTTYQTAVELKRPRDM